VALSSGYINVPLPAYNYRVTIGDKSYGFSEVSGLSLAYEPVTYKHGLSFLTGEKIIPGMRQAVKLILKRGITQGEAGLFLADWLEATYANPYVNHKRDILIDLCDEKGLPAVRWKVARALPVKLDAPTFTAIANEVAIESLELIAHEIKIEYNPS